MVKTNTKLLCKDTTNKMIKYWTEGSYILLNKNSMLTISRPLISIGYNYNARKVLYLIATKDTGITNTSILYLSKYPYPFSNFSFSLFLVLFSCLSSFDLLMRLTHKKNPVSLI